MTTCYNFPSKETVEKYTEFHPSDVISLLYQQGNGINVIRVKNGMKIIEYMLNNTEFVVRDTRLHNITEGYQPTETIHLDPISLIKVLFWNSHLNGCSKSTRTDKLIEGIKEAGIKAVEEKIKTTYETYNTTTKIAEKKKYARKYLFEVFGAYLVLLSLNYKPLVQFITKNGQIDEKFFNNQKISLDKLVEIANDVHVYVSDYIRVYKPITKERIEEELYSTTESEPTEESQEVENIIKLMKQSSIESSSRQPGKKPTTSKFRLPQ